MSTDANDKEGKERWSAFVQGLRELGWIDGRTVQIDSRWGGKGAEGLRKSISELVALRPDVILASGGSVVAALLQATHSVPIVFTQTPDPVGAGFVDNLARPGGNVTGFSIFDYNIAGKWLELLKQVAPNTTRAAVIRDAGTPQGIGQFSAVNAVAPSLGIEVSPINSSDLGDVERAISVFARNLNSGLIVTGSNFAIINRERIIQVVNQHKLPAVYPLRFFIPAGGLISYGPDAIDPHRRAAGYVDRILHGEKPAEMPVQAPTKYEMVVNLKTAKSVGLTIPSTLLARADEIIE
jgi:putative ABC transport system substrate-binding protein